VTYFNVLSRHLLGGTEGYSHDAQGHGLRADIRVLDLPNTKHEF
jgi:hypothetical protein